MTILSSISTEYQSCDRCTDLGRAGFQINPDDPYMILTHQNVVLRCCEGCWEKLVQEVQMQTP